MTCLEWFQVALEVEILQFRTEQTWQSKITQFDCWLQKTLYLPSTHWRNCIALLLVGLFDIEVTVEKPIALLKAIGGITIQNSFKKHGWTPWIKHVWKNSTILHNQTINNNNDMYIEICLCRPWGVLFPDVTQIVICVHALVHTQLSVE